MFVKEALLTRVPEFYITFTQNHQQMRRDNIWNVLDLDLEFEIDSNFLTKKNQNIVNSKTRQIKSCRGVTLEKELLKLLINTLSNCIALMTQYKFIVKH